MPCEDDITGWVTGPEDDGFYVPSNRPWRTETFWISCK
jgi:hypothetical protein